MRTVYLTALPADKGAIHPSSKGGNCAVHTGSTRAAIFVTTREWKEGRKKSIQDKAEVRNGAMLKLKDLV